MSRLTVFAHDQPQHPLAEYHTGKQIAVALGEVGVRFERWEAQQELADDATQEDILAAYRESVDRLVGENGFQTVDVIHMKPDNPQKDAFRQKFLSEHTHTEDEVRFFVEGSGLFSMHIGDRVYVTLCEKGDLISVPANTRHWFDMGPEPEFTAIRFFNNPEGWVAHYTDDNIAQQFPLLEPTKQIQNILCDIEGTTSSISFVKDTLFPYARKHMADYLQQHWEEPDVATVLNQVREETGKSEASLSELTQILQQWIDEDRKATPLKTLQGLIWDAGYHSGDYRAHMYPDAVTCLKQWKQAGINLMVYSSGSVKAQHMFFEFSDHGDLRDLFSAHFDTQTGQKKEAASYDRLARNARINPSNTLFLSDVVEELDAAKSAGFQTCLILRENAAKPECGHPTATDFIEVAKKFKLPG